MNKEERISHELHIIDSLLQDEQYAADMAAELDAAITAEPGKSAAISYGKGRFVECEQACKGRKDRHQYRGVYALECGLGLLCAQTNTTVYDQLQKILADQVSDSAVLLLKRFANATWKAGQPFKGMARIKKANLFLPTNCLLMKLKKKDLRQIKAAAIKFSQVLRPGTMQEQMQQVSTLLRDTVYTMHMAAFIDSMYYIGQKQPAPPFITPGEKALLNKKCQGGKNCHEPRWFYATECATNYLVTTTHKTPSEILQSLVDGSMSKQDEELYARFANATWKAGQPFRSLNKFRETHLHLLFLNKG